MNDKTTANRRWKILKRVPLWFADNEERQVFHVGQSYGQFRWPWSTVMSVRMARETIPDWLEPINNAK